MKQYFQVTQVEVIEKARDEKPLVRVMCMSENSVLEMAVHRKAFGQGRVVGKEEKLRSNDSIRMGTTEKKGVMGMPVEVFHFSYQGTKRHHVGGWICLDDSILPEPLDT